MSVDRIACPKCGSNNFSTQARCWSCGTPLGSTGASALPSGSAPPPHSDPRSAVSPSVAIWSAVALGLLFPFVAVPVGMVFLMLDDRRKVQLGWQAILWGIVGTVLSLVASAMLGSMLTGPLLQAAASAAATARGASAASAPQ